MERRWDEGEKTILGETGTFNAEGVVKLVLQKPVCAHHLAGKIWRFFAYENADPELSEGSRRCLL